MAHIFFSEDYGGTLSTCLWRYNPTTWISGFGSGDDDPVGMAVVLASYSGPIFTPGHRRGERDGHRLYRHVVGWHRCLA